MSIWLEIDQRTERDVSYDRTVAWCLAVLLFSVYLITYSGVIQSSDGLAMFATAENIVRRGAIDSNQILWMGAQQGNIGPDGDLYSRKGPGMTFLAVPLVWLAHLWQSIGLAQAALLLNPILTAWTAALVYLTGRRLNWSPQVSAFTALAFGMGTFAWPYTQTFFSDPVCMWGLFAAAYGLLAHAQTGRKRYLFAAGLAWSIAYLARVINLITLPIFAVGLIFAIRAALPDQTFTPWRALPTRIWTDGWRPLISFTVPVVLAGLYSLYWNWARYGNIWDTGYVETERFSAVWWFGISGLLVGPARGFFWYSPILLLALWGAVLLWRKSRAITLFSLAITLSYVLLYGKWYMWHGGYSWGPRFLIPIVPFVTLFAGAAIHAIITKRQTVLAWAAGLLAAISVAVQFLGLLVPFGLVQDWLDETVQPLFAPETFTRLEYSPLIAQWQFLQPEHLHIFWMRDLFTGAFGNWPATMWLLMAALLIMLVLGFILLRRLLASWIDNAHAMRPPWESNIWEVANRPYVAVAILVTLFFLTTVYDLTANSPQRVLAQRIGEMEQPGDAIIHLRPGDTQAFSNSYHGRLPVYGHRDSGTLDEAHQVWHASLRENYDRLWIVAGMHTADQSGWETEFRAQDFLLYDFRATNGDESRLVLYASSQTQSLQEAGLGTIFGDPDEAGNISAENGWIRLSGYGLLPETSPGSELLLALRWETLQTVDEDYHVFVHLLNQEGSRLAQRDGQPVQWTRPTSTWQPGEEIIDRYGLLLSPDLPHGDYTIAVGLYEPESGQRLPVSAGPSSYAIEIGPIHVRPRS